MIVDHAYAAAHEDPVVPSHDSTSAASTLQDATYQTRTDSRYRPLLFGQLSKNTETDDSRNTVKSKVEIQQHAGTDPIATNP